MSTRTSSSVRQRDSKIQENHRCQESSSAPRIRWTQSSRPMEARRSEQVWLDHLEPTTILDIQELAHHQLSEVNRQRTVDHGQKSRNLLPKCAKMPSNTATAVDIIWNRAVLIRITADPVHVPPKSKMVKYNQSVTPTARKISSKTRVTIVLQASKIVAKKIWNKGLKLPKLSTS